MALDFLSPLHKASRQISVYLESRTSELGVSPIEGHVLTYLRSYAPGSIGDLVRVFGIKQSTFTSLLDRLERGGFVRRVINPDDRRSFLVHITDKGTDLATRLTRLLRNLEDEIRDQVGSRDVKGFHAVMGAVDQVTRVRLRER
jgi:MarR family transcriptional regulator, organic hydroperoxide resistance regulator